MWPTADHEPLLTKPESDLQSLHDADDTQNYSNGDYGNRCPAHSVFNFLITRVLESPRMTAFKSRLKTLLVDLAHNQHDINFCRTSTSKDRTPETRIYYYSLSV